jgi:hypothetical protein
MKRLVWTVTAAVALAAALPVAAQSGPAEPPELQAQMPSEPSVAEPSPSGHEPAVPGWRDGGSWRNASDWADETAAEPSEEFEEAPADAVIPDDPQ